MLNSQLESLSVLPMATTPKAARAWLGGRRALRLQYLRRDPPFCWRLLVVFEHLFVFDNHVAQRQDDPKEHNQRAQQKRKHVWRSCHQRSLKEREGERERGLVSQISKKAPSPELR
ncbi:hypothetical protein QOT17_006564 [Balamuthia mandrillaris]